MASFSFLRGASGLSAGLRRGSKLYDLLAGAPLVLIYGISASARLNSLLAMIAALDLARLDFPTAIAILSNASTLSVAFLFVVFVLIRPPAIASAPGLMPRVAALAGTYLAVGLLLSPPAAPSEIVMMLSLVLVLGGSAFTAYAIFYLGRSISLVAEARRLVTGGPYRYVRHPLYLGEEAAIAGAVLQHVSPITVLLFAVQIAFQFYRMSWEEKVLAATFPDYAEYSRRTWRILPWIY